MILITGDIHGWQDISKLGAKNDTLFSGLTKADYLIICGDFGLVWDNSSEDIWWQTWLDQRNFTTLFVDGNHENFDLLNSYPVRHWHGGKVHMITDSIIHLMRGQVFDIDGRTFFTMGGAESHDKAGRVLGKSLWKEELPDDDEYTEALNNLKEHNFKVDHIITHCATTAVQNEVIKLTGDYSYTGNQLTEFFDELDRILTYRSWFCGHYHVDMRSKANPSIQILFDDIIEV